MRWWLAVWVGLAHADDDEAGEHGEHGEGGERGGDSVAPVTDATWRAECGSCHTPYAPGLLPVRSWTVLLGDLPHHFGEDASVSEPALTALRAVASARGADVSPEPLSVRLAAATRGTTPLRISEIPWLRGEHREEIPASRVVGNPAVRSWAACAACHPDAVAGRYDEGRARVPPPPP